MGNVELTGLKKFRLLNLTFLDRAVVIEVVTDDGSLRVSVSKGQAQKIHESLGAWLDLKKRQKGKKRG